MGLKINLEELEYYFTSLEKKMAQSTMDSILEEGAKPIIEALNKNVPVDTGELKSTLGEIKKEGSGVNRKAHFGSKSDDRKIIERAYYQEYGNSSMVGKKWIKKSYLQSKDEALAKMSSKISEVLTK